MVSDERRILAWMSCLYTEEQCNGVTVVSFLKHTNQLIQTIKVEINTKISKKLCSNTNAIHPNKHSPYSKPTLIVPVLIQSFSIPFSNYQQPTCLVTAEHLKTIPSTTSHKIKL